MFVIMERVLVNVVSITHVKPWSKVYTLLVELGLSDQQINVFLLLNVIVFCNCMDNFLAVVLDQEILTELERDCCLVFTASCLVGLF
jgi:hypothetical protein